MDHIRDVTAFHNAISLSNELLNRDYLRQIKKIPLASILDSSNASCLRLIKLLNISKDCSIHFLNRVVPILDALNYLDVSLGYILQVTPCKTSIYLAIKSRYAIEPALELIQSLLHNKCPDLFLKIVSEKESYRLLTQSLFCKNNISSLSSLVTSPFVCNDFIPEITSNLKTLLCDMANESYTLLFLATSTEKNAVRYRIDQLENLYSLLDSFKETTFTYHHTSSGSSTTNISLSKTASFTTAATKRNTSESILKECTTRIANSLILNARVDDNFNYIINTQPSKEEKLRNNLTTSDSITDTQQDTEVDLKGDSETSSKGNNSTFCFKGENKKAQKLLKKIEHALAQLYALEYLSCFNMGIYFLSPKVSTTLRATFTYLDLLTAKKDPLEETYVTTWQKEDDGFEKLVAHLSELTHPCFVKSRHELVFTPTHFVDSHHLSHLIAAPTTPLIKR